MFKWWNSTADLPALSSHDPVSMIKSALGFYGQNYKMVFFRHGHNMWGTGIVETHSNSVPSRDGATSCCVLVLAVINAGHTRGRGWDTWDRSQCARCVASAHLTLLARCRDQVCPGFLSPLELQMKVREDFTITETVPTYYLLWPSPGWKLLILNFYI